MQSQRGGILNATVQNYIHLDLKAHAYRPAYLRKVVEQIAEAGVDGVLLESEDKLSCMKPLGISSRFSADGVLPLLAAKGLNVIPLVQTVGHAEYVLSSPRYAPAREAMDSEYQYCLCSSGLVPLLKRMIDVHLRDCPAASYISLGGDEPWYGGMRPCLECSRHIERAGLTSLYVRHLNTLIRFCIRRKVVPMVWGDYLIAHTEAMQEIDKRVVLKLWNYTHSTSEQWRHDVASAKAAGLSCWIVPAVRSSGDSMFLPNVASHLRNCASAIATAGDREISGLLNTAWGPRLTPMETVMPLLYASARAMRERPTRSLSHFIDEYGKRYWGLPSDGFSRFYSRLCPVWPCFVEHDYPRRDHQGHWHALSGPIVQFEAFLQRVGGTRALRDKAQKASAVTNESARRLMALKPTTKRGLREMALWHHLLDMQQLKIQTTIMFMKIRQRCPIQEREWTRLRTSVDKLRDQASGMFRSMFQPTTFRHELRVRYAEETYLLDTYAFSGGVSSKPD